MSRLDPVESLRPLDRKIAQASEPGHAERLGLLRRRLIGEMVGDVDRVLATIADSFTLVMRNGADQAETSAADFRAMVRSMSAGNVTTWAEWHHLIADGDGIAAHGVLTTLAPDPEDGEPGGFAATSMTGVMILEFGDGLMTKEIVYIDPSSVSRRRLPAASVPSPSEIVGALALE